jgi:hypothetical protein
MWNRRKLVIISIICSIVALGFIWALSNPVTAIPNPNAGDGTGSTNSELIEGMTGQSALDNGIDTSGKVFKKLEVAKLMNLAVLDRAFALNKEAVAFFEFTSTDVDKTNACLKAFTEKLFDEEVSRAFVEISPEGEVIVVPSFDRRPFYATLKNDIAKSTNQFIANAISERIIHDSNLGCVTSEIRVSASDDASGVTRVNITRAILKKQAFDPDIPLQSEGAKDGWPSQIAPTIKVTSKLLVGEAMDLRIRHLIAAGDRLPKKNKP